MRVFIKCQDRECKNIKYACIKFYFGITKFIRVVIENVSVYLLSHRKYIFKGLTSLQVPEFDTRVDLYKTKTPCRESAVPALNTLFCGKQSVQVTARPISNVPASKAARTKFESANFATLAVECERSESEKSIVSKLLKKRSKADEEKQDRSLETSAELDEKSEWKSLIKANRNEKKEANLESDEEKVVNL